MHLTQLISARMQFLQDFGISGWRVDRLYPRRLTTFEHRWNAGPLRGHDRQTHPERLHQDDRCRFRGVMGGKEKNIRIGVGTPFVVAGQLPGEFDHLAQREFLPQMVDFVFKLF